MLSTTASGSEPAGEESIWREGRATAACCEPVPRLTTGVARRMSPRAGFFGGSAGLAVRGVGSAFLGSGAGLKTAWLATGSGFFEDFESAGEVVRGAGFTILIPAVESFRVGGSSDTCVGAAEEGMLAGRAGATVVVRE